MDEQNFVYFPKVALRVEDDMNQQLSEMTKAFGDLFNGEMYTPGRGFASFNSIV